MNWLDAILLLILVASVISSFRKGLVREAIHFASVVLGILLGAWFYQSVAEKLAPYIKSPTAAKLAGFLLIFVAVHMVGSIIVWILGKFLRVTGLSFFDHIFGAGFGFLRGLLVCVALIMGVMAFSKSGAPPQAVVDSRIAPYVSKAANVFAALAPQELKDGFHKTYEQAHEVWTRNVRNGIHTARDSERKE